MVELILSLTDYPSPISNDDLIGPGSLLKAANVPGAQVFVFPPQGPIEVVMVLAPDRFVWDARTDNGMAWIQGMIDRGLCEAKALDLEATLAWWCEWVPRAYRPEILGAREVGASSH